MKKINQLDIEIKKMQNVIEQGCGNIIHKTSSKSIEVEPRKEY
jgi:hypothetical protein